MSPFELFFSLFGLILGLAMAVIISGVSDVLRERVPEKLADGPFLGGTIVATVWFWS